MVVVVGISAIVLQFVERGIGLTVAQVGMRKSSDLMYDLGVAPLPGCQSPPGDTRSITCFVGNPYKPSFPTVTVRGPHPMYDDVLTEECIHYTPSYMHH